MKYLEDSFKVTAVKRDYDYNPTEGIAPDGYTKRSGAPTSYMVQLNNLKRWYRVMVWQFSNVGTCFVRVGKVEYIIRYEEAIREKGR